MASRKRTTQVVKEYKTPKVTVRKTVTTTIKPNKKKR
jgi:hypothetical protein